MRCYPPVVHACWSSAWIMRCSKLMIGVCLFRIFDTHHLCCMKPCLYIVAMKVHLYYLVVIGWTEEGLLRASQVVEGWGVRGYHLGVGSSRLGLPPVPLRMCTEVVWSILCPLRVLSLEGGSGPACLGGRVLGQGSSIRCRFPRNWLHNRWGQSVYYCDAHNPACSPK